MSLLRQHVRHAAAAAVALGMAAVACFGAWAQSGPIKIVVPFPPGGAIDVVARVMADGIGRMRGPAIVVENRPGGAMEIATEAVIRAKPDGNTVLIVNNSFLVTPHLLKVRYDPLASLEPICRIATTPTVIVVSSSSPYRRLADLLAAARAKPGALTYGSAFGGVLHIGFAMLQQAANVQMTFVPYQGTLPAVTALLGGNLDTALVDYPAAAGQIQAGTLRVLTTGSRHRLQWLPDVPTVVESGYPDYEVELWYGLFAPAKTPSSIITHLADLFSASVRVPEAHSRLLAQGVEAEPICGAEFGAYVRTEYERYGRAIADANIKAE
jgi:tripartite-type tricarboxylate transporter receptor subunit TctC